jgi:hypothetical protein
MSFFDALWNLVPEPLRTPLLSFLCTSVWAWIGRMMWHVAQVQRQKRRFWSWHLLWETLTAVGVGLVADGVVEYFGLTGNLKTAVVVGIAYLGPRGVENLVMSGLIRLPGLPPRG